MLIFIHFVLFLRFENIELKLRQNKLDEFGSMNFCFRLITFLLLSGQHFYGVKKYFGLYKYKGVKNNSSFYGLKNMLC